MYLESCEDEHMHYRCFDVTEKTNIKRHKTGRNCSKCQKPLSDTIVHFGEMNRFNNPYRWESGIYLSTFFNSFSRFSNCFSGSVLRLCFLPGIFLPILTKTQGILQFHARSIYYLDFTCELFEFLFLLT